MDTFFAPSERMNSEELAAEVASLGQDTPFERICALPTRKGDRALDIALLVRSCPIRIDTKRFLLLLRVLCNMVTNLLEATVENGVVKVWLEHKDDLLSFHVWNAQAIPQEITNRIFQRNFSTKEQAGREVGTYSMKLFGEEFLGGQVNFTTSEQKGTVFRFIHPL